MSRIRVILATCFAALVFAGTIASSQAIASEWVIRGETLSELALKEEGLSLLHEPFTVSLSGISLTIECKENKGGGKIIAGGAAELKSVFAACKSSGSPGCKLSGSAPFNAKLALMEAGGNLFVELLPLTGTSFGTWILGEECSLGEEVLVKGALAGQFSGGFEKTHTLKFSEEFTNTINKELEKESRPALALKVGSKTATASGKIGAQLGGAESGKDWDLLANSKLCKVGGPGNCPPGEHYGAFTQIKTNIEGEALFELGFTQTLCSESWLEGETDVAIGDPLTGTLNTTVFTNCTNGCVVSFPLIVTSPYPFFFVVDANGMRIFRARIDELLFTCGARTCSYSMVLVGEVTNGGPATFATANLATVMTKLAGSPECAVPGSWQGFAGGVAGPIKYKFTAPSPLHLKT